MSKNILVKKNPSENYNRPIIASFFKDFLSIREHLFFMKSTSSYHA